MKVIRPRKRSRGNVKSIHLPRFPPRHPSRGRSQVKHLFKFRGTALRPQRVPRAAPDAKSRASRKEGSSFVNSLPRGKLP